VTASWTRASARLLEFRMQRQAGQRVVPHFFEHWGDVSERVGLRAVIAARLIWPADNEAGAGERFQL
jgi:hypothetical protein